MRTAAGSINRASILHLLGVGLALALTGNLNPAYAQSKGVQLALFGFGKSDDEPKAPPAARKNREPTFCPKVVVQPGTAAFTLYERGKEGDPLSVRYQANFTEFARECVDLGAEIGARIGIVGRALIGPLGAPGQVLEVPVRFVVLDDAKKVIVSTVTKLQVTIPDGQTGITFTHVEELGSVPFPGKSFRKWEFRVGFETKPPGAPQG